MVLQGFNENDVYVCESRYMHRCKGFKKIKVAVWSGHPLFGLCYSLPLSKVWNFLPGPQPKQVLRGSQLTLNRVPSVFATKMKAGGEKEEDGEEAMEEEGSLNDSLQMSFYYNFQSVPVSVTNPDHQCTYYEQFCIDDNTFKTGGSLVTMVPLVSRIVVRCVCCVMMHWCLYR